MARPFWQKILQAAEYNPFINPGGANLGYVDYERKRLENIRTPYQMATDPRFRTGTGPGLGLVESPSFSGVRQKGNIGEDMVGAVPRPEDFQNPLAFGGREDDDWFKKLMQLSFMQSFMPEREKYTGTSIVRGLGRDTPFREISYYTSPFPGGTNV
jgi:hypothetical protein